MSKTKSNEQKHAKDIKIFPKKKKKKTGQNLSEEQKQKQVEYMRNY